MVNPEDDLLYESDDKAKVNSLEPDWNPYNDGTCDESRDMFEQLFETDSDDCEEFYGF